jgi:hypothetical protein
MAPSVTIALCPVVIFYVAAMRTQASNSDIVIEFNRFYMKLNLCKICWKKATRELSQQQMNSIDKLITATVQ